MFEEDNVMFLHLKKTKLAYALNQMGSVGEQKLSRYVDFRCSK